MAEDTEVSVRITAAGYPRHYAPQIRIRHQIRAGRLTRRLFVARAYRDGASWARFSPSKTPYRPWNARVQVWRHRLHYAVRTIAVTWRAARLHFAGQPAEAIRVVAEHARWVGSVTEHDRLRRLGITEFPVPKPLDEAGRPVDETVLRPASN